MTTSTDSAPLILPNEIRDRFTAVSELIGKTHRALGLIIDEYVSELPHGLHMAAYELFADLYHQTTGETISVVTIRHWRHSAVDYQKNELEKFESLTDAQLTEAVKLAEINKIAPADVCEWAVQNAVATVPAMRAHWLPQTSNEYQVDEPPVIAIYTAARRWFRQYPDKLAEFESDILPALRRLFAK